MLDKWIYYHVTSAGKQNEITLHITRQTFARHVKLEECTHVYRIFERPKIVRVCNTCAPFTRCSHTLLIVIDNIDGKIRLIIMHQHCYRLIILFVWAQFGLNLVDLNNSQKQIYSFEIDFEVKLTCLLQNLCSFYFN